MVDPIAGQQAQAISLSAKASGLARLLQGGPQNAQVLSTSRGKAEVMIQGQKHTLDVKANTFRAGQQVMARLIGGKPALVPLPDVQPQAGLSSSIQSALQQMGLGGQAAQTIAQSMIQSGMPLDKGVMTELMKMLPNVQAGQLSSLVFMLSRGMPINASLAAWVSYILQPRPGAEQSLQKLRASLKELQSEKRSGKSLPEALGRELDEIEDLLGRRFLDLRDQGGGEYEEELQRWLKRALSTLEAQILSGEDGDGDIILRLIRVLQSNRQDIIDPRLATLIDAILESAQDAHESLTAQALKNLPPQNTDSPVFFAQIPFKENGEEKELEFRYKKESDDSGTADVRIELSALGPLWLRFGWKRPHLTVSITVESEAVKALLEAMSNGPKAALSEKGFIVDAFTIRIDDMPETLEPENPAEAINAPSKGFDVRG